MVGAILAEFAGTRSEAKEFAEKHGFNFARNKASEPNGLPYISLKYKNHEERMEGLKKFEDSGWDSHSVIVTEYKAIQ